MELDAILCYYFVFFLEQKHRPTSKFCQYDTFRGGIVSLNLIEPLNKDPKNKSNSEQPPLRSQLQI